MALGNSSFPQSQPAQAEEPAYPHVLGTPTALSKPPLR